MIPLVYVLKNRKIGETEQIALATLHGLRDEFVPYIFAPDGAVIEEAQKLGFQAQTISGAADFTFKFWRLLVENQELGFVSADYKISYSAILLNFLFRRKMTHLHIVDDSFGKADFSKRSSLNKYDVTLVAESRTVREKLIADGARNDRIRVIEHFLPEDLKNSSQRRFEFKTDGVKKIIIVTRIEEDKRIELLFEAVKSSKLLQSLEFKIYGTGSQLENLKAQAERETPNISFEGLGENITQRLSHADLYLHLSPDESTNLTILGAMAADVPVLVPDIGDETIITHNVNGFCFKADDAQSLAARLEELSQVSFDFLNAVAKGGRCLLKIRFSAETGIERFRRLVNESKSDDIHMTHSGKLVI